MSSEMNEKGAAGKDMKAEGRNGNMNADSKGAADKNLNADSKGAADSKATTTTGPGRRRRQAFERSAAPRSPP